MSLPPVKIKKEKMKMKQKKFIKFAVLSKVYTILFRLRFYKTCAKIYPHLIKSLGGYTTQDGMTVL